MGSTSVYNAADLAPTHAQEAFSANFDLDSPVNAMSSYARYVASPSLPVKVPSESPTHTSPA
jgi:hypothetical protein